MNLPKKLAFLIFFLLLIAGLLRTRIINVQAACKKENDPEYHSLRPYPAEPCDEEVSETALFCGNDLVISDTVSASEAFCQILPNGKLKCRTTKTKDIAIDLTDAEFPIMGITETGFVVNSQEQPNPEEIDDAEKVNEYVSWYLNGVTGRAEYGPDDTSDTVNFSGPIKKLLPQSIQYKHQIETIEKALAKDVNDDRESQERSRHNQIVVCTNLLDKPTACYGSFLRELVNKKYRLSDWDGTLIGAQIRNSLIDFWMLLLPDYPQEIIRGALGDVWEHKTPPLPWQDRFKDNPKKYLKAYYEWRGKTCVLIPFVNLLICHDLPILSPDNKYADLFPYIPFSSTEDRVGLVDLDSLDVYPSSEDVEITNVTIENWEPAELYFAHMEEGAELANILQDTFVPSGAGKTGGTVGVSPTSYCDLVNVRTNPGDDLHAGEVGAKVTYTAEFTCDIPTPQNDCEEAGGQCYDAPSCQRVNQSSVNGGSGCPSVDQICCSKPQAECKKNVSINLSVLTKTPKADEVWERTVAGPSAIFKRIFPKVGPGGAILGILDIPAATKVTYTGADFAGNPGNQRSGEGAELYFPHIGGVSEYFLKGIQTILRPKGYGEQILSGQPGTEKAKKECDQNVPDSAVPSKYLGSFKENFIRMARDWSEQAECRGLDKTLADECYNNTVKRSVDRGVNPAFTLTIWLNETGASNYCESGPTAQDFGVRDPSIFQNYGEQLERFLDLPYSGLYNYCKDNPTGDGSWLEPMHAFLSRFRAGNAGCDPSNPSGLAYYNDLRDTTWQWVTGGCVSDNKFSISWPTDTSCP